MTLPNTIHTIRKSPPHTKPVKKQRHVQAALIDPQRKQQDLEAIQRELSAFCAQQLESLHLAGGSPETPLIVHAKRDAPSNPPPAPKKQARTTMTRAAAKSQVKTEPDSDDEWDEEPKQEEQKRVREESKRKRADEDENEDEDEDEEENEEEDQENNEDENENEDESEDELLKRKTKPKKKKQQDEEEEVIEDGIKRRSKLPQQAVDQLEAWFVAHVNHPYPTDSQKSKLSRSTGLTLPQIQNWFTNTRKRRWLPHLQSMNQQTED